MIQNNDPWITLLCCVLTFLLPYPHACFQFTEYKYIYKAAVRKRHRTTSEDVEDVTARLADLSYGHGGRTPMPEIEMLQEVQMHELPVINVTNHEEHGQAQIVLSDDEVSSSGSPSIESDELPPPPRNVV